MKNIIITGASSGVGKYLTEVLSNRFKVIAIARRVELMQEDFKNNPNVSVYGCDLSNLSELEDTLQKIKNDCGYVSYIINNAGIMINKATISENFIEDLQKSITINALAPIKIIRFFLKDMIRENFGRVINITSGAPLNCYPNFGCYSASKALLNSLIITLSNELSEYNIKVNLMSPGPVRTEMAPNASMDVSVCLSTVNYLLNIDEQSKGGGFYWLGYKVPMFPDLTGVNWLEGIGNEKLIKVL